MDSRTKRVSGGGGKAGLWPRRGTSHIRRFMPAAAPRPTTTPAQGAAPASVRDGGGGAASTGPGHAAADACMGRRWK
ncbi:unnamed protein product [Urochloa humidicola]